MVRATKPRAEEEGFALVEAIVAAAVMAAMMGLTYQTVAANAQAARLVAERREAALVAQSLLAEAMGSASDAGRIDSGTRGDLTWRIAVAPWSAGERGDGPPLEQVAVRVSAATSGRPLVTLNTLRLSR